MTTDAYACIELQDLLFSAYNKVTGLMQDFEIEERPF